MNNKVEIDGSWYELVPMEKQDDTEPELEQPNAFYGIESVDGVFNFSVLLDDDGKLWKDTQSLTYKPKGGTEEHWDNPDFLKGLVNGDTDSIGFLPHTFTEKDTNELLNVLNYAVKMKWL